MTPLDDRDIRIARIRAGMDRAYAAERQAQRDIRRLTKELIKVGAEVRAETEREDAHA